MGSITNQNGGFVAPGASTGILTCSNATFAAGSAFNVELNGTTAGSGYDRLTARGTVNLGDATLNVELGVSPVVGNSFTLIDNDGADAVIGTFNGLPEGAVVGSSGNVALHLSYVGGTGNDVVLTARRLLIWDGSSDGKWSTAANWTDNVAPANGDDLQFPANAVRFDTTNNLANLKLGAIIMNGSNYLVRGNSLTLSNGIVASYTSGSNSMEFPIQLGVPQALDCLTAGAILGLSADLTNSGHLLTVTGAGDTTVSGVISGAGGLTKSGIGTLLLNGSDPNTYAGVTTAGAGTLALGKGIPTSGEHFAVPGDLIIGDNVGPASNAIVRLDWYHQIADDASVVVNSSGALVVYAFEHVGSLAGSGSVFTDSQLVFGDNDASTSFNGLLAGDLLIKHGSGTFTLTGLHSVNSIVLSEGAMIFNGTNTGRVLIDTNTIFTAQGSVSNIDMSGFGDRGGILRPGSPGNPGSLICTRLFLSPRATLEFDLNGTQPGVSHDQITLNGDATLDNATLNVTLGFVPATGQSFTLIDNDDADAVSGTFNGLPEGAAVVSAGNVVLHISYTGGDGNDVVLVTRQLRIWDGSSNGNWSTAANWTGNVAPVDGDDLEFPANAVRFLTTNNLSSLRLGSIVLSGSNYIARGNGITLSNGITAGFTSGSATVEVPIQFAGPQSFHCDNVGASLTLSGNMTNAGHSMTVAGSGNTTLSGVISGSGGLNKSGSGTLQLAGANGNTYTGATTVNAGLVELNKSSGEAIPGALVIGDGDGFETVRLLQDGAIGTVPVTINESGLLDLNNHNDAIGALTLNSGDVTTGTGLLTLGGNLAASVPIFASSAASVSGNLSLGAATRTINVLSNQFTQPQLSISANISGDAGVGFTKSGTGELRLSGVNTYSGLTTVSGGLIRANNASAFGSTAAGTVLGGGSIRLVGVVTGEPLTNNRSGSGLEAFSASCAWSGSIVLNSNLNVIVVTNRTMDLSGAISGPAGIIKTQPGTLIFSGAAGPNSYAGNTLVNEGVLELGKAGAIVSSALLTIGDGAGADIVRYSVGDVIHVNVPILINESGLLDLNDFSGSVGPMTLTGGAVGTGTGFLLVNDNVTATSTAAGSASISGHLFLVNATTTFTVSDGPSAIDLEIPATIGGGGGLAKAGGGALRLSGINTYTGRTTVGGGTLRVDSSQAQSPVTVATATLAGSGTVGSISNLNTGAVAPGASTGILTCGDVIGAAGSTFRFELNSPTPGTGYDQLKANGTVNLGNATLDIDLPLSPAVGDSYTVIDNDGSDAVIGTFNSWPEGAFATIGNVAFRLSYKGGDGNDVVFTAARILIWRGLADGNWSRADNWLPVVTPASGDELIFPLSPTRFTTTNDLVGLKLRSVRIGGPGYTLRGNGIALTNGLSAVQLTTASVIEFPIQLDADQTFNCANAGALLTVNGNINNNGHVLTVAGAGANSLNGVLSGSAGLVMDGSGTLHLNGVNTYTGLTTASNGVLLVNGVQPQSRVSVSALGTLGGAGTVGNITNMSGGVVAPGASAGLLTCSNVIFSGASSDFTVELNGPTPGAGYDQLKVRGSVSLGGAKLNATLGFQSALNNAFTIIDNDSADAVIGTFNGLPQGATLHVSGIPFRINYTGGTGNDVVLTQLADPPVLSIQGSSSTNVVLSWLTNFTGFTLESNTNLNTAAWTVVTPPPVVRGVNNVVTNQAGGTRKFYRLQFP